MTTKNLENLFSDGLKDIYYAEKKILKGLKKMSKSASSDKLVEAFDKHYEETGEHVERLEQVFDIIGKRAQGKTCPAIDGILDEGAEIMEDYKDSVALDAGLIAAAQAVEHYEIGRYGTLKRWAECLGKDDVVTILDQTLSEEMATDENLSELADEFANDKALQRAA